MKTLKIGDKVIIPGIGIGKKGQFVVDGVAVKSRRKCRAVKPAELVIVYEVVSSRTK